MVRIFLILPNFDFSSDGDFEDWQPAFQYYAQMFPNEPISENLKKIVANKFDNNFVNP